jgi:hypothetical protein
MSGPKRRRREVVADPEVTPAAALAHPAPLTAVRVSAAAPSSGRSLGRRSAEFAFNRVFVPSLVIDHTELVLRQAGVCGEEGFVVWAGSLAAGDGYISSVVIPSLSVDAVHGEVSVDTTARLLDALDQRDLVPIAQLHSHPRRAFLSGIDAVRPLVAMPGFLSIVIPSFGFIDLAAVDAWSAHAFIEAGHWHELTAEERSDRFIIDDSLIRVD